jgi:hypothetical protein
MAPPPKPTPWECAPCTERAYHLTELVTAFVQDKPTIERGLFDEELVPEELTQVRMGKIVQEKFPDLEQEDQEAVRQQDSPLTLGKGDNITSRESTGYPT